MEDVGKSRTLLDHINWKADIGMLNEILPQVKNATHNLWQNEVEARDDQSYTSAAQQKP